QINSLAIAATADGATASASVAQSNPVAVAATASEATAAASVAVEWLPETQTGLWQYNPTHAANVTFATPAIANTGYKSITSIATHALATGGANLVLISARTHWGAGPGGYGRCANILAASDGLKSDRPASDYNFLHSLVTSYTVLIPVSPASLAVERIVYNTKATAGTGIGIGVTALITTAGAFTFSIGNNSNEQRFSGSAGDIDPLGNYVIAVRYNLADNGIEWEIFDQSGASVATGGDAVTISPNAVNDAGQTLQVCPLWLGMYAPPVIWKSYFDMALDAAPWATRYIQGYTSWVDYDTNEPHGADSLWYANAGAVVVLRGPAMGTIGTPTLTTSANYSNKDVVAWGAGDGLSQDSLAVPMNDKPHASFVFCKPDNSAVSKYITAWNSAAATGRVYLYSTSTEAVEHFQGDDASGTAATTSAAADITIPSLHGFENIGQSSIVLYRRSSTSAYSSAASSNNVGNKASLSLFGYGTSRPLGVVTNSFSGTIAGGISWTDGNEAGNMCQGFLILQMLYSYYQPS
ncbi:MAG TPA: hypothetical protein VHO25_21510, partial [Polyangiaceae bacterium]|nr:hypothetical protein [Polyangiaceae bacterium]